MSFSPGSSSRPPLILLLSIALLSAALLSFEIALTRVFAVVLRYHFAFLIISIALCGLGVGGYAAHWWRARRPISLPVLAALFGLSIDLSLLVMLRGLFAFAPEAYWLAALIVLVPFSLAGAFLAEAFALWPRWSSRLYAWDLAGAALAAAGTVGVLQIMSAPAACALAAIAASLVALLLVEPKTSWRGRWPGLMPILLLAVWMVGARAQLFEIPAIPPQIDATGASLADRGVTQPLFTELGTPGHKSRIIETRWNAFARTDVVDDPDSPFSYLLYTNGNVPTNMMKWDGQLSSIGAIITHFPLSDWAFAIAPLPQPRSKVLSIGPGGGLDALLALHYGAKRFDGAEINPSIPAIMRDYAGYNGGIYNRPNVHVAVADGRAWSREALQRGDKYGLVFSALTKTATAGQGMALLESFIHTINAFDDYWQLLEDGGQATILLDQPILLARFTATWLDVLARRGLDTTTAMRHIALVADPRSGPYQYALVVQKTPFSRRQTETMYDACLRRRLTAIWIPDQAARSDYGSYPSLADGSINLGDFVGDFQREFGFDISPCPDDRPFVLDLNPGTLPIFKQLTGVAVLLSLALATLGIVSNRRQSTLMAPAEDAAARQSRPRFGAADVGWIAYFFALGIGFMLIEIPLAQKLILPLGYPTLALSVILFSVLLGGGIGSWFSQRWDGESLRRWAMICALGIAVCGIASTLLLDRAAAALPAMNLLGRCVLAAVFLLPLGFLLGAPFPSGMRLFAARREGQIPLVWGLNGVASVVGSLCAAIIAKSFGFERALMVGAVVYLVAAALLLILKDKDEPLAEQ